MQLVVHNLALSDYSKNLLSNLKSSLFCKLFFDLILVFLSFFIEISKYLFSPKSPFEEALINFPFLIVPINLKFLSFSERGAFIVLRSISISLFKLEKNLLFPVLLIIFGKFSYYCSKTRPIE